MTAILEAALARKAPSASGAMVARKQMLAEHMAEFVTTGTVTMPDGKVLEASPKDWIETAKWVYAHIDGAPKQDVDMSGGVTIRVVYDNPDTDAS